MAVFLLVRRKKTSVFISAQESDQVLEVKKMIEGILKKPPSQQELFFLKETDDSSMVENSILLNDSATLLESGITPNTAKAQDPAILGLAFADETGNFEQLDITAYSSPPPLPDVLKPASSTGGDASDGIKS